MKGIQILIIILLSVIDVCGQGVLINEFVAKNNNGIQDEDGDFSDWIELYNSTGTPINLVNYRISDDSSDINKWIFPEVVILPNSYLLVFASGKNRVNTAELHTNFKLSATGEDLFLSNNIGVIIDQVIPVSLSSGESYGRIPDGSSNWFVIDTPSPNYSNNGSNLLTFSHQEGFYTSPFSLTIDQLLTDTIYYTLNGDIPTVNSNVFTGSLLVDYRSAQPNTISEIPTSPDQALISYKAWESPTVLIDKATVLRCASYNNGVISSKIHTKTFFVDDEIMNKYTMPVISLVTEEGNLFNADSGLYVPGENFNSNDPEWSGNYFMRGSNWERDVHVEYFKDDGTLCFSQDAGMRIHGGKTRHASQKSLRLYARNEYGKEHFNHRVFPQSQVNEYERLILRTTMGDWEQQTMIKDIVAQNISSSLNVDHQDFQPAIVYVNGEYWGVHTIRDRIDERFIAYTHNINRDFVEFMEWNIDYHNLMEFVENNDLSFSSNYQYVISQIDVDNYIDYMIAEQFFKNYDWPANNMKLWREIPNGKWRWVFYDIDAGFGDVNYNMLYHTTSTDNAIDWPNPPSSTLLFRSLLENDMFKSQFIARYAEILNNEFAVDVMASKLDSIQNLYSFEIADHIDRWNYPNSYSSWEEDIENDILYFLEHRPCIVRSQIMSYFSLPSFEFECGDTPALSEDLILAPNPTTGKFFIFNNNTDIVNASIAIASVNGQVVYKENNVDLMRGERKYFDLMYLSNNTYVLQIVANDYFAQKKVIVAK